jgi:hypothetical protein
MTRVFRTADWQLSATEWIDRALDLNESMVASHVRQVRAGLPDATAAGVVTALENQYLAAVSGAGAAVGGAASVPGIGTGIALGLSAAETVAFVEATALLTLAVAHVHAVEVPDLERRRALLLTVLLGDDAIALTGTAAGKTAGEAAGWGTRLLTRLPDEAVTDLNRTLQRWMLTRFGRRQGLFAVGRLAPFGLGAAVGAAGNALTGRKVIGAVRSAFGGIPASEQDAPPHDVPATVVPATVVPATDAPAAVLAPATDVLATEVTIEPPTGKYRALFTALAQSDQDHVEFELDALDALITGGLPASARRSDDWWSDRSGARGRQAGAWKAAGFTADAEHLTAGRIGFRRQPAR